MGSTQFAPWARQPGLALIILMLSLINITSADPTAEQYRDTIMRGDFGRSDLLTLLRTVPRKRFTEDGADRNATPSSSHTRHIASRETKRERPSVSPPYWYPYQNGEDLKIVLAEQQQQQQQQQQQRRQQQQQQQQQQPDGLRQANLYPTCEGPSDATQWQPNGKHAFQFFFPQIAKMRSSDQVLMPRSTTLYLRLKGAGGWRLQKSSTPSLPQTGATPNDVDTENISLNTDSTAQTYVIINVTEPGCRSVLCHKSIPVDLSSSYPYAKLNLRLFGLRWFTTTDTEAQRIEVTATDPQTKEPLDIGDLFVGMRCGTSEPRLSLPGYLTNNPSRLEYLEGLADSFLSVDYSVRSAFSSSTDRATISHTGLNLHDLNQRFQPSVRRARLAPGQPRLHHHHRSYFGRPGSGHHRDRIADWPLTYTGTSKGGDVTVDLTPTSVPELRESWLRCDKQREFLTFAAAGMPTVVEPLGFMFVSCKCTRVCADASSSCLPCETRVLASQTLTVKELVDGEMVTRQRTIPTDCGCY